MVVLYEVALSPYAQKVKIALIEKGIDFETRVAQLGGGDADLERANPRGEVPALLDGEACIFDSSIILEYLEDKWPTPPLLPAAAADRARVRMIEEVCDSQFEAACWGMTELLVFKRAEGETAKAMQAQAATDVGAICGWLERQLGGRDYFNGTAFGFGDIAVFPYLQIASLYKLGPAEGCALAAWLDRVRARDSVQRAIADAKAALDGFRAVAGKIMSGEAQRQYRDHRLEWMVRAGGLDVVRQGLDNGTIRFSTPPS